GWVAMISFSAGQYALGQDNANVPAVEVLDPGDTGQRIEQNGLFGNFFPAKGDRASEAPAILMLGGSEGGLGRGVHVMALELQQQGFTVFHMSYFGAPGQPEALERIPLEVFDQGVDWLKQQPGVDPNNLGVLGASKGAEAALLVASRRSDLKVVVAGMPSSVVWNGINWAFGGASMVTSWTADGDDLTTMPYAMWNPAEGVISVYRSIEDPDRSTQAEQAAIPIEQSTASVLLICGEAETMWPACPMSRMLAARSREQAGPAITILAYEDAGHFLFGPPVPEEAPFYTQLGAFGGSVEGNASARADSWPKVVEFLTRATRAN
ncbi:MAG: acyl-CoA thioester hydrolase/BAAT C-terminal domain-containing protein, partial [Pseudomonadota bacterium]